MKSSKLNEHTWPWSFRQIKFPSKKAQSSPPKMAEAVVSITLDTICNLALDQARLYCAVGSEIDAICTELQRMRSFLKDADSKHDSDNQVSNWVSEVREAAYDIEDILLDFAATVRRPQNSPNPFTKILRLFNESVATYRIGTRIPHIRRKISDIATSFQKHGIRSDSNSGKGPSCSRKVRDDWRRSYSHVVEEDFVGLEDDIKMLVAQLVGKGKRDDRGVSICGMGGLGKTTIARKVYTHPDVRRHFDGFAWTCVTQKLDKKDVLQGILIKLLPELQDKINSMSEDELVKQLHQVQRKKRCLVVLDDVWNAEDLQRLAPAFPSPREGIGSKMLLTTRKKEIAVSMNPNPYEPRSLNTDESWELLRKKAVPRNGYADEVKIGPDMERLGKKMVERCCGLPLAVIVLGGVLITKNTLRDWEMVSKNIDWYLANDKGTHGQQRAVRDVLAFSYHDLSYKFKQCFLYLANFPEDFEIEAEKLYQLWLADGLISQEEKAKDETMMDVAERYLAELAQRFMVQVKVKETAGGFKSCRLHDRMRDICRYQAKDENFTVDFKDENNTCNSISTKSTRRVSFYLEPSDSDHTFVCSDSHHTRSAFFYVDDYSGDFSQQLKSCISSFKLLRVLVLQWFSGANELPKAIGKLIHLRYLDLSSSQFKKLPSSLGKLIYLQTLNLEVDTELEIPNIIWKMEGLKYLYLPAKFRTQDREKLRLKGLYNLETLVNFNTRLCYVEDLDTLSNLRKLRAVIKDNLDDLPYIIKYISFMQNRLKHSSLSISCLEFCSNEEMNQLRTLLSCHRLYKLSIHGKIAKLPDHYHFSMSIAKIAFRASVLVEDPMTILEKLQKLSSLTLYDSAYVGEEMACLTEGFPRLLYLKLWGLPNLKRWRIEKGAMPKLTRLVIACCDRLEMLPDGLRFLTGIKKMNVRSMPDGFKDRLRIVDGSEGDDCYKVRHIADIKID